MRKIIGFILIGCSMLNSLCSQSTVEQYEALLSKTGESDARVELLNELAWELRLSDFNKARDYAEDANELAKKLNYKKGEADSYARLGVIAKLKREFSIAEGHYQRALELRKEIGYLPDIGRMSNSMGSLYEEQVKIKKAIKIFKGGLEQMENPDEKDIVLLSVKAKLHNNIGDSYRKVGEYDHAIENLEESIDIRKRIGDTMGLAESYMNVGVYYSEEEVTDIAKSGDYLRKSLLLFEKHKDVAGKAQCLLSLGNLFFHRESSDSARLYYGMALKTGALTPVDSLKIFRNAGSLLFQEKKYNEALGVFLESLQKFEQIDVPSEIAGLYSDIGNTYYENDNYANAIEYLEKSRNLADSLNLFGVKMLSTTSLAMAHGWEVKQEIQRKIRNLLISFVILWTILGVATLLVYSNRKKRQLAEKNAQIAMQEVDELLTEQELKTAYARLEGQDEERNRVALDLHDRIGSMLSTVKLYFASIDSKLNEIQLENREQYVKATQMLDEACQEVRRISHDMGSPILTNLGLEAELKVLAKRIEEAKQLKVKVLTHGFKQRLDGNMEVKLYRIIQELVANALKHAKASEINIQLNRFDDMLNVMVEDNGAGFDPAQVRSAGKGMGLANVASRVNDLGGTFEIDSKPGNGTTVMIDIPLRAD